MVFQYLKEAFKKAGDGLFSRAYTYKTGGLTRGKTYTYLQGVMVLNEKRVDLD